MSLPTHSRRGKPKHAAEAQGYEYIALGIDPGTGTTGYGVVGLLPSGEFALLACGVIRTPPRTAMHLRLEELFNDLCSLIEEFHPQVLVVEKLFFGRNVTTAISVGQARGIVLLAAALAQLNVAEYTPAEVKQAIAGYGNADKRQVQEMVQRLLDLPEIPRPDDAADGVAIAVCHLQSLSYHRRIADAEAGVDASV
ncbi:MAG: crossover junction endodeoxyribonuclease RuvC [Caldilineaceae bacterium]|nr:crossover junction endodeoxyribonuclease RuvC [Caldilineaceae bacterium]